MSVEKTAKTDWSLYQLTDGSAKLNDKLQQDLSATSSAPKVSRPKRNFEFFAGPINIEWLYKAGQLNGATLQVAIVIHHLGKMRGLAWVPLSNGDMARMGVSPDAKTRGLKSLEHAGLIEVKRQSGKSPQVKVLDISI